MGKHLRIFGSTSTNLYSLNTDVIGTTSIEHNKNNSYVKITTVTGEIINIAYNTKFDDISAIIYPLAASPDYSDDYTKLICALEDDLETKEEYKILVEVFCKHLITSHLSDILSDSTPFIVGDIGMMIRQVANTKETSQNNLTGEEIEKLEYFEQIVAIYRRLDLAW